MGQKTFSTRTFKYLLLIAALLFLTSFLLLCPQPSAAQEYDFWVQTPTAWQDRTNSLGNDLRKQVVAPGGSAFIEVYAAGGMNIGVQAIADKMEYGLHARGVAYIQNRISSTNIQADGHPAILREYTGYDKSTPLRCHILYTFGSGAGFMVVGVFDDRQADKYRDLVYQSVTSLRFSTPGSSPATTAQPGGVSPYAGTGTPRSATSSHTQASDCDGIIGKWQWFNGSKAEFGANGFVPGDGNRWECLRDGIFKIIWNNGQWIDTLTLSGDGTRLEGKNQIGNRVWGQRIGQPVAASSSSTGASLDTSCCQLFGSWNWTRPGVSCVFMPDNKFLWQSKAYRYDCGDDKITIHWSGGKTTVLKKMSPSLLTFVDKWGETIEVIRKTDYVVLEGKTYKACAGGAAPTAGEFSAQPSGPKVGPGIWGGTWYTHPGTIVLTQKGSQVSGTYSLQNGKVSGYIKGNTFVGKWSDGPTYNPPMDAGKIIYKMAPDGKSFKVDFKGGYEEDGLPWFKNAWTANRTP